MAPSSCLLTGSPDSELMVQTFLKKSFLIANLLLLAFGLNASLAPNIFFWKRETILCGSERASPEKRGPISEDTALGPFFSGMDKVYGSLSIR